MKIPVDASEARWRENQRSVLTPPSNSNKLHARVAWTHVSDVTLGSLPLCSNHRFERSTLFGYQYSPGQSAVRRSKSL
jgi:hypothetical protein